ncbi:hypothetical protein H9P43_001316 [Blastocladiella emersonii ATCC 22665]|nr:hypothetical protein H9P43_001316 [Blastocladiella emersonii ATCC 22665]
MSALKVAGGVAVNFIESPTAAGGLLLRGFVDHVFKSLNSKKPVIIDGPIGAGKTCTLEHVVSVESQNDANVIVHVKDASEWFDGRYIYNQGPKKLWELPTASSAFLQSILSNNQTSAAELKITAAYAFGEKKIDANSPLSALLTLGARSNERSSDVTEAVLEELAKHPNVLLAVDHVNAVFSKTRYFNQKSEPLHASQFVLGHSLLPFFEGKAEGKVIGATSKTNPRYPGAKLAKLPTAEFVHVPPYTTAEASQLIDLYLETKLMSKPEDVARMLLVSGGNPKKFLDLAKSPRAF